MDTSRTIPNCFEVKDTVSDSAYISARVVHHVRDYIFHKIFCLLKHFLAHRTVLDFVQWRLPMAIESAAEIFARRGSLFTCKIRSIFVCWVHTPLQLRLGIPPALIISYHQGWGPWRYYHGPSIFHSPLPKSKDKLRCGTFGTSWMLYDLWILPVQRIFLQHSGDRFGYLRVWLPQSGRPHLLRCGWRYRSDSLRRDRLCFARVARGHRVECRKNSRLVCGILDSHLFRFSLS